MGYHLAECRHVPLGQVPSRRNRNFTHFTDFNIPDWNLSGSPNFQMALDQVDSEWGHLARYPTVTCSSAAIHLAKCTDWSLIQVTSLTEHPRKLHRLGGTYYMQSAWSVSIFEIILPHPGWCPASMVKLVSIHLGQNELILDAISHKLQDSETLTTMLCKENTKMWDICKWLLTLLTLHTESAILGFVVPLVRTFRRGPEHRLTYFSVGIKYV